jgi:hypothetical protein
VHDLSTGGLGWIRSKASFLDSSEARAELPPTPRVKGLLQLALLCHYWGKARPESHDLAEVTAVVRGVWEQPGFPGLIALDRETRRQHTLMYGALAPAGVTTGTHRAALAQLAAEGCLTPGRRPAYLRLAIRFYADLAGVSHDIESYDELYESSVLAGRAETLPLAKLDVCEVTHTIFYLSDFGFRDVSLGPEARERARHIVYRLTDHCVEQGEWDLLAKLVLAQFCLGVDPTRTPSGAAAIEQLARAQSAQGAIPRRRTAGRSVDSPASVAFFRKAYQATLGMALASVIISR